MKRSDRWLLYKHHHFEFCPVLEKDTPVRQGIDEACLDRLYKRIEAHIAAGWYPGAAIAMARHGVLVAARSFGVARLAGRVNLLWRGSGDMWLLYSQTEADHFVVPSGIWWSTGSCASTTPWPITSPNFPVLARGG